VAVSYGSFINTVINFLIIAFTIFLAIKAMNMAKKKEEAAPPPAPPKEEVLLTEIRDLLKNKALQLISQLKPGAMPALARACSSPIAPRPS
jgi:hypothetical protein